MAWTPTTDVSAGSVLTATDYNEQVLGNLDALRGDFARSQNTSTPSVINSTTWTNLGGVADLTLAASSGDFIEVSFSALILNEATDIYLDVVTVVSGNPVNAFGNATTPSNTHQGILCWAAVSGTYTFSGGSYFYKLVSGDVSGGNVVLRMRARTQSATNRTVQASSTQPMTWFARNHGPVEI